MAKRPRKIQEIVDEHYEQEDRLQMSERLASLRKRFPYVELVGLEQGSPEDPLVWLVRNHTDEGLCAPQGSRWSYEADTPHAAVRAAYVAACDCTGGR